MKQRALAAAVLGAGMWLMATPLDAFGGKYDGCGGWTGGPVGYWPAPAPVAPPTVQYVPQTITRYRAEVRTREVPVTRFQMVPQTQTYTYSVNVPVTTTQKQQVTEYQTVTKQVPYTYTITETVGDFPRWTDVIYNFEPVFIDD